MDGEREVIHALSTETHTQNMGKDNNSPPENVHNTVSGILNIQNMEQDNNSPPENVNNTVSGILGKWMEKEKKYMHF
jgi:hypothetical protein